MSLVIATPTRAARSSLPRRRWLALLRVWLMRLRIDFVLGRDHLRRRPRAPRSAGTSWRTKMLQPIKWGIVVALASALPAALLIAGQQAVENRGAPEATTAIPGEQLPPPPQKFGGKIDRNAAESKPYWPA